MTLCLHNSFCRNSEINVDPLPCCKQRVEEQKCWRTASNSVRIATDVLQDTESENAETMSQEEEMENEDENKERNKKAAKEKILKFRMILCEK